MWKEGVLLLQLTLSLCANVQAQVTFGFNQTTYSVREDAGNISISVSVINGTISGDEILTLSTAAGGTATAGGDYIPVTTDLTFSIANTAIPQTVAVAILDDLLLEDFETFNLTLTAANINCNATLPDPVTVTIEDVDGITVGFGFCPRSYFVTENAGRVNIIIEVLKGTPARDVIVTVQTVDSSARAGSDYEAMFTNLTFNAYMPTQMITIPIFDDLIVEYSTETFRVTFATTDSAVTLGIQTATVYISDDDRVTIGFNTTYMYSVSEGAGSVSMTVSVLNGTLARSVSVFIPYVADYTVMPRTLAFNGATGSRTVTVFIRDDAVVENQFESFSISLRTSDHAVILNTTAARVTIEDNDLVTIGFSGTYSVHENSGRIRVTVSVLRKSLARNAVVTFSTLDNTARAGMDYTSVSRNLIFNAAVTTQVVEIPIIDDLIVEHSEIINLNLTSNDPAVILNRSTSTVAILDADMVTIGLNRTVYSVSEDAGSVSVTVSVQNGTLDRDVIVTLSTTNGTAMSGEEYTPVSTNVSFNASTSTQTVNIPILDNMIVADSTMFSVALSSADTAAVLNPTNANITIEDEDTITIRFHPATYTVAESAGSVNVTVVNMLNGTLARDVHVFLMTSLTDGTATATVDYKITSSDLTFNATTSSVMVTIPILEDSIVEGSESIIVTLTSSDPAILSPPSTCVTIEDNDGDSFTDVLRVFSVLWLKGELGSCLSEFTIGFSLTTYSVSEDVGNTSVAVSLFSGTLARDATISLQTLNNTAVAGMDFQDVSIDLTFNSSSSTQTVMVSILNDAVVEETLEYFSLILTSTDSALTLHPMTANITIRDDIDMVTIGFDPVSYFVLEDASAVNVTVSILNGTLARNVEVFVSALPAGTATAEEDNKITMTFGATISTQMAIVPIPTDDTVEFINLVLASMDTAASLNPATATINLEDTVQIRFENPSYVVAEDSGNVTVCATATGQLARDVIVTITTADGTAMAPDDYTSLTQDLTFNGAVNNVCKNTIIIPDSMNEVAAETFTISLNSTDRAVVLGQSTTVIIVDHPVITSDPASQQNVVPGTIIVFTVEATGSDLTYQWQKNGRNLTDGTNYSGTTTANLTVMNAVETDEGNYTCVLTNAVNSITSNAAELTLLGRPQIIQHPADQLNVDPGSTVMFTVTATTAVGALTYQWQLDGSNLSPQTDVTGITTHTLTLTSIQESSEANYSCVVTNARGSVKSNPAQLTILDIPTIITDPYDVINVIPGHNVTFSLRATGLRLTYTWQQGDGRALPNNSRFITNNETLIIQEVMLSDPNSYRCVVTNAAGNATSISANFTLIDLPVISVPPQSIIAEFGSDIEIACTAEGEGTLTFAWTTTAPVGVSSSVQTRFNLQDGSETSILSLTNVGANHSGVYACSVSNERGSTPPLQATLTIIEISDIPDRTVTLGINTTFTCSATGPGDIFYRWNRTVLNASGVLTEIGFYNESRVRGQHTSTLMVINVGVRDRGHYTCFVSFNSTNTRDRTAILSTHAPTIFEGPYSVNAIMGSDITLECVAQNNADAPNELQFYWYHNGHSITPSRHITINSTSENATRVANSELMVLQVTESDSGEYQCTVTNRDIVDGVNATADVTVLSPPGEVNHTLVTRELLTLQSVRLTWLQPEDNHGHIISYNITYCLLVNNSCGQQTPIQTLSFTETAILSQLIPARTYQVYIRAENDVGQGPEPTQQFSFESANQVDAQPVGMNAAFVSATTVVLVWQLPTIGESAGVDSFILSYTLRGDSEENTTHTRQPSAETMTRIVSPQQGRTPGVVISGLNSSAIYNFKVSINYSNPVLLSAETSVTVHTDPFGSQPSTNITVPPIVQRNVIVVMWPPPGGEEFVMNYVLVYTSVSRVDQQTTSGNITISSNQTFYNFTPPTLQPYSDYTFVVFGELEVGKLTQIVAPFTAVSQEAAPSSPIDLQVKGIFHISIDLSWSAPLQPNGNIIQYTVYYWPISANEKNSVVIRNYTSGNTYTLGGLFPNTIYNICVTAKTNGGEGEGVRVQKSTTFGVYPPEIASVNLTADQDTQRMMIINSFQTTYGPLSHYKVVIMRDSNTTNTKTDIPDNTLLPNSQSQTPYYVAAAIRVEDFQSMFLIGDGQTYMLDSERFVNVPLSIDQEYTVFIRLYSSLNYTVFEDSIPQTLTTTLTTTSTLPPVNIEVTVASIVPVLFLLLLLILILLIVVAVMRKNRKNAVGAAPSEVELHSHESQGTANKSEPEGVDTPSPDHEQAKETVEEIAVL